MFASAAETVMGSFLGLIHEIKLLTPLTIALITVRPRLKPANSAEICLRRGWRRSRVFIDQTKFWNG